MSNRMKDMRGELTLLQESQRFASTMPETIGGQLKQPPSPSPPRPLLPFPPPASPTIEFLPPPPPSPSTTGYIPLPPSPLPEATPRPTKLLGAPGSVAHTDADEGNIVGRGENKQRIIATLSAIDITQGPAILPIFGLAAVGKTALAEMVFKDAGFGEYKFRIWVNVTPKFDLPQIGNHIISKVLQEINLEMENQRGRRPCRGSQVWEEEMSTYTEGLSQESEEKINQATYRYSPLLEVEEETKNGSDWASQVLPEEINKVTCEASIVSEEKIKKGSDGTSQVLAEVINKGSNGVSELSEEINSGSDGTSRVLAEQINKGTCEIAEVLEDQEISTGVDGIPPPVKEEEQMTTWDFLFGLDGKLPGVSEKEINKGSNGVSQLSEEEINNGSDGISRVLAEQINKGTCEVAEVLEDQEFSTGVDGIPPPVKEEEQLTTWDNFVGQDERLPRVSEEEINKGSNGVSQVSEEEINYGSDGTSQVLAEQINKGTCEIAEVLEDQEFSTGVDGIPPPVSEVQMVTWDNFSGQDEKLPRVSEEETNKGSDGNGSYGTSRVLAEETHQDSDDVDCIRKRLHELLNGMKALIVLDDVWEEDSDELERLKRMLGVGIKGSKVNVIVTTCNGGIARKVCTVVKPYKLDPLINDMCWTIIKQKSGFGNRPDSDKQELERIGLQIASKCGGLPLAAQELGRSLHHQDAINWAEAMNRDIWSNIQSDNDVILRSLELSYISLPPALRLCFAYCAIFPQGDTILKDDIIHQWIALGLVEPYSNLSITQVAEEYITRLLDISFLQTAESDASTSGSGDRGAILLTMHELAHALARSVCDELIVSDERMCTYECCRYAVLTDFGMKLSGKLPTQLRAVRCTGCSEMDLGDDAFSFTRYLRVLHLNKCSMQKLPDSICRLRQLGYLNLSGCSQLVYLPESFGSLFNLWHVNLSRCYGLTQLPKSFKKLRRLVYLDLSFWCCFEGISVLGGLTSLKHLNLSHPCCYRAEHRPHLEGLKDVLCKLTSLQYLNLSMCMNPIFSYLPEEQCREYIRSCTSGLSKLKHLDLSHNIFLVGLPESLGELQKLHTLDLTGCIRLKTVAKRISENESLKLITRNCRDLKSRSIVVCTDDGGFRSNLVQLEDVNCLNVEVTQW